MRELSLNVLDIAQNSLSAGASLVEIAVSEDTEKDELVISVRDNGRGMTPEQAARVRDPFYTTRTTLQSELGKGTEVTARFVRSHIDRMPLGDMVGTMTALIRLNPQVDFVYRRCFNGREAVTDTRELRQVLGEVPLDTPEVMEWIDGYLREQEGCVTGTQHPSDREQA